jgi:hypothetical protein
VSKTGANGTAGPATPFPGFVALFERLNHRTPTEGEVNEALALCAAAKASGDPYLAVIALGQEDQAGRNRTVAEMRAIVEDAEKRLPKAVEAAVTHAIAQAPEEAPPAWLSRVIAWLREHWPAVASALARSGKVTRSVIDARWPIAMMWTALALALIAGISVTAATVQRGRDVAISQSFSTSAGVAAMKLAAANPDLAESLTRCSTFSDGAHHVMDCKLWPIGSTARYRRGPEWYSMALGIVFDWVSSWPVQFLTAALVFPWVIVAALGFAKRGPATRLIWHPRWRR